MLLTEGMEMKASDDYSAEFAVFDLVLFAKFLEEIYVDVRGECFFAHFLQRAGIIPFQRLDEFLHFSVSYCKIQVPFRNLIGHKINA